MYVLNIFDSQSAGLSLIFVVIFEALAVSRAIVTIHGQGDRVFLKLDYTFPVFPDLQKQFLSSTKHCQG